MTTIESLYHLFGVQHTCTDEELRRAYCQLISNFHPDRNPDQIAEATAKTQELNAAYQELKRYRSIQRGRSHNAKKNGDHRDQFGFESGGINIKFGFGFGGIDPDAIIKDVIKRKTDFRESYHRFRENPADPICALLLIQASFEAERHEYV
jgi:DnaJ-class molecular chaperone